MSKQPPPAPTARTIGPCPTVIQISRTPRHWKFSQHPTIPEMVQILPMLEVLFTQDSKVEDLFSGAPSSAEPKVGRKPVLQQLSR